jgi:hypothetical protein
MNEWFEFLYSHIDKAVYVIGAQGQHFKTVAEAYAFIDKREKNLSNRKRAKALLQKRLAAGIPIEEIYFFDCSGLGISYFLKKGYIKSDYTAHGIYTVLCDKIKKEEVRPGDCVFQAYATGRIHHVGYVTPRGNVECKGRDYGVGIFKSSWNRYGRPKFFKEGEEEMVTAGSNKQEIMWVQTKLLYLGYDLGAKKIDGDYGPKTTAAGKKFMKEHGLPESDGFSSRAQQVLSDAANEKELQEMQDIITKLQGKVSSTLSIISTLEEILKG